MAVSHPFERLGLPRQPVILAPLAGVSDHPFRRICAAQGADLTYVEMLTARALVMSSRRTYEIAIRHPDEAILGVQLTGSAVDDVARAVAILDRGNYETIDLNMGCPVNKVVKAGCGSALLKDPEGVFRMVKAARAETAKPLSVKVRLGWDRQSINIEAVADAVQGAGADWITIHGRTRADDYGVPVDLDRIAAIKRRLTIPVIGNGNIFSRDDADHMRRCTGVDGVMVSRGALGNPWLFRELKGGPEEVRIGEWAEVVTRHLEFQQAAFADHPAGAVCMRKHLLWYVSGWPGAKRVRDVVARVETLPEAMAAIREFTATVTGRGGDCVRQRPEFGDDGAGSARFKWDPKFEMDRQLDRGVGDDHLTI